jgi:hypothetical protein
MNATSVIILLKGYNIYTSVSFKAGGLSRQHSRYKQRNIVKIDQKNNVILQSNSGFQKCRKYYNCMQGGGEGGGGEEIGFKRTKK